MQILIACEFSGTVRDAFIKAGHKAVSCDILPTDVDGPHIQDDLLEVLKYTNNWDLMIAHPPCTYLSNAGARHLYPKGELNQERLNKGLVAKQFFMTIYNANIPMICIENPIPSKIYELPQYNQVIQPYEYGHEFSKKTCLWLKNLPPLMATMYVEKTESTKVAGNWFNKGGKDRQKNRAKTFQGIANAMAQQWGN
jgi:hypothetical protein